MTKSTEVWQQSPLWSNGDGKSDNIRPTPLEPTPPDRPVRPVATPSDSQWIQERLPGEFSDGAAAEQQ